jgi:hypothetical protein
LLFYRGSTWLALYMKSENLVKDLQMLIYLSSAAHLLSEKEMGRLLERARIRNAAEGITGILIYHDGCFVQYLEGPASGLAKVYKIIQSDPVHHGIIELLYEDIESRLFPGSSLSFCSKYQAAFPNTKVDNSLLLDCFAGVNGAMSSPITLLAKFWKEAI